MDVTCVMAADNQMPPDELEAICAPVVRGEADYAKANRLVTGEAWELIPHARYLGNAMLSLLTKIASGYWHVADSQSGYTAISLSTLQKLDLDRVYPRYGFPNDLLVHLNVRDARVRDVPSRPVYNVGEQSGIRYSRVVPTISWLLLKAFFWRLKEKYVIRDFHPLVFFYVLGLADVPRRARARDRGGRAAHPRQPDPAGDRRPGRVAPAVRVAVHPVRDVVRPRAEQGSPLAHANLTTTMSGMSTCVVTGGAGFLGSHLCDYLLAKGHRVICVDNLETSSLENLEHIRSDDFVFVNHDVIEPIEIDGPVDVVYHLAALASPIDYLRQPLHSLKVGSYGTHHALGLAKWKRARFLLASTSEVYGDPLVHPQPESYWGNVNPIGPRGVYDEAKRYAEALTMAYHSQQGVDTAIVRIFNTYGPRMRPHDGRAIPTFVRQALAGEPLTVFGDGSQTRSFCYVDDLIRGLYLLATSEEHLPVNIGNPDEFTLLELAHAVLRVTGSSSEIVFEALPVDDPQVRQPDITRARQVLGWEPEIALEEGLRRMLQAVGQPVVGSLGKPFLGEQPAVERVDVVDEPLDGVALEHARAPASPIVCAQLGVARELGQALGHRVDVARLDEEAVDAVADDVRHAADARRDDRPARRERLDRAHRRALVRRREHERVERGVVRRDVVLVAEEEAVADDAELVRPLLERRRGRGRRRRGRARASTPRSRRR